MLLAELAAASRRVAGTRSRGESAAEADTIDAVRAIFAAGRG